MTTQNKNEIFLAGTEPSGAPTTSASNNFFNWGNTRLSTTGTETDRQLRMRAPLGDISGFNLRIQTNSRTGGTGADTVVLRKNGATSALSISITNAATGNFSDLDDIVSVADADLVGYALLANTGVTGTIAYQVAQSLFSRTDATNKAKSILSVTGASAYVTAGATNYTSITGNESVVTTESQVAAQVRDSFTVKNFAVYVNANTRTATTIAVRKGAASVITASIGANGTGYVEETTTPVTYVAGDTINFLQTTGTGSNSLTVVNRKIEILQETTASNNRDMIACLQGGGTSTTRATTSFLHPSGLYIPNSTTEANNQLQIRKPLTYLHNLTTNVLTNSIATGPSVLTVRIDGADTAHTCSIGASATGHITTASSALTSVAQDALLSIGFVSGVGAGTNSVVIKGASMVIASQYSDITKVANETVGFTEAINKVIPGQDYIKLVPETVGLTEAYNLIRGRIQQLSDTLAISEQISRAMVRVRTINDATVGLSEAITVSRALRRVLNETVGLTEQTPAVAVRQLRRVINETIGLTEAVSSTVGKVISINNETVTIQEALNKILGRAIIKTADDTVGLTEAQNITRQIVRILTATVGISEAAMAPTVAKTVSINEAIAITEAIRKLQEDYEITDYEIEDYDTLAGAPPPLKPSINEMVGISETVNFLRDIVRVVNESVTLSEATIRLKNMAVTLPTESVGITEAINRLVSKVLAVNETVGVTEAVNILAGRTRAVDESVGLVESVSRLANLSRTINETVGITEAINKIANKVRTVNETIGLGEAYNIARNLIRIQAEQIGITEALAKRGDIVRMLSDTVGILHAAQRNLQLTRVVNETLGLTDAINAALQKVRVINETVGLNELVDKVVQGVTNQWVYNINETINVSEALNRILSVQITKVIDENVSISEAALVRNRVMARTINENVGLVETLNRVGTFVRTINESIFLQEQLTKVQQLVRALNETVNIADSANQVKAVTKILNEVVGLSETQISAPGKVRVINEALSVLESIISVLEVGVGPAPIEIPPLSLTMALSPAKRRKFPTIRRKRMQETRLIQPEQHKMKAEPFKPIKSELQKKQLEEEHKEEEKEKEPAITIVVESSLTLRWKQDGSLTITELLARLDRPRPKPVPIPQRRTIQPEMRQSAIFLRGPLALDAKLNLRYAKQSIVESSLSIRYHTRQQVDAYPPLSLNWQTLNTVESSLTIAYNQEDAARYQQVQELKGIVNTLSTVMEVVMATTTVSDSQEEGVRGVL